MQSDQHKIVNGLSPSRNESAAGRDAPALPTRRVGRTGDIVQLVYVSRPTLSLVEQDARQIAASSRRNNWRAGLTGCLLFTGTGFAQALEGRAEPVLRLYDRIARDPRHTHVRVVLEIGVKARAFPDWAMGFVPDFALAAEIGALLEEVACSPASVARLMTRMTADAFLGAS